MKEMDLMDMLKAYVLTEREAFVLDELSSGETCDDIAKKLDITKERVEIIKAKAFCKLERWQNAAQIIKKCWDIDFNDAIEIYFLIYHAMNDGKEEL